MRVLIAPDKFKGSLSAEAVALAVASGLRRVRPDLELDLCPVADGGEGTLDAAISAGFRRIPVLVEGPVGQPVDAAYGERNGVALIELAEAAGLRRLDGAALAPLTASTFGTGQLIDAAIRAGNRTIVLAIGGSASTDGGAGIMQALGARLTDAGGRQLGRGGGALSGIAGLDLAGLRRKLAGLTIVIASDVQNPLLGASGAAEVFGPQKGASTRDVQALEAGLARWAVLVAEATGIDASGRPGAGAAGGVGFGAMALLGATMTSGADLVLDMVGFPGRVQQARLVITGEGSLDEQTLAGKAPVRVAAAAAVAGVRTVAVAGRCTVPPDILSAAGISAAYTLASLEPDLAISMAQAGSLLAELGAQLTVAELGPAQA